MGSSSRVISGKGIDVSAFPVEIQEITERRLAFHCGKNQLEAALKWLNPLAQTCENVQRLRGAFQLAPLIHLWFIFGVLLCASEGEVGAIAAQKDCKAVSKKLSSKGSVVVRTALKTK